MKEWEKCIEMNPSHDLAWRNLGWAHWLHTLDYAQSAKCYKKAIELNPDAPLYLEECDQVLEAMGAPVAERYEILKSHHATAEKRYHPLSQEVVTGTYVGDYDYVLDLLDRCYFPTREGVANFHDNFVDALVLAGQKKVKEGDVEGAIALYMKAFTYPENHQVFLVDERATHDAHIHYYLGEAYEKLGQDEQARAWYKKAAEQDFNLKGSKDFRYWTGLALKKLGKKAEAKKLFKQMIKEGKSRIVTQYVNFYGAEGTTGSTVDQINSGAYFTQALGHKGLGHNWRGNRLLRKVKSLKPDHLYANELLK
jgi:tetratricopeptide (TPR) repeat protein